MIPDEDVERVREMADIVAIIGEHVALKKVGTDFRGPCPFHQGTHKNFSVSTRRRMYHCFVCGEGGDVFSFLMKRLGIDWLSAVRIAAQKSGIELREIQTRREGPDPKEPFWEVNGAAQSYFERVLWEDPIGQPARDYLVQREISEEAARRFGMGFAPREIGLMRASLATLGFDDARLLEAGLLVRQEEASEPRPRFRARIVFPIHDASGRIAGFGGRLIGPGEPKYLNTGETPAFTKGKLLYGLHMARNPMRRSERALVVEGYVDVLRLNAAGIEEVVAPLGTALTSDQAALLTRYSKNVFLMYDSDKAGLKATFRAGDALLAQGAAVRVVTLPSGEDPDTFVQRFGGDALEKKIDEGIDVFERKVQLLQRGGWFADLHRRRKAIDHLLPTLRAASDPLTRDMYVGRAAEASGLDRQILWEEVSDTSAPGPNPAPRPQGRSVEPPNRPPAGGEAARVPRRVAKQTTRSVGAGQGASAERELVRAMLQVRAYVERVGERLGPDEFRDVRYREIFATLLKAPDCLADELAASLSPPAVAVLDELIAEPDAIENFERTVRDCLTRLELRALK
ncbi:MAG: DNA primase, partial [Gemmatimonadaceae bacterium]